MDPYGNYDGLLIQPRYRPLYRVEEAAVLLPYRMRLERSFMNHPFYPLSLPLMKRPDDRDSGLGFFDVVTLVDISPGVFDSSDLRTLQGYVESGGALLVFGGPNSLGNSVATYAGWEGLLPVAVKKERKKTTPAEPVLRGRLAKFSEDLGAFGAIENVQVVEPRQGAAVLADAGGMPLVVAQQCGRGRVMVIPAFPGKEDSAVRNGVLDVRSFFDSDGYANLMGLCFSWLLRRDQDLRVAGFKVPRKNIRTGAVVGIRIAPDIKKGHADFALRKAGHETLLDRDGIFNTVVMEKRCKLAAGAGVELTRPLDDNPQAAGIYRCRVTMEGNGEGKGAYEYINLGFYGITVPKHGYNAKMSRIATFTVEKKKGIRAYPVGYHNAFAKGDRMEVIVEPIGKLPVGATVAASMCRAGNDDEKIPIVRNIPVGQPLVCTAPDLQTDEYELEIELTGGGQKLDCVTVPVVIVAPLREEETTFCAVGQSTGMTSNAGLRAWFDEMVSDGFNCFTVHNVGRLSLEEQRERSRASALESYWSELVQKSGFPLWAEYSKTVILATHGWRDPEGAQATKPCPYTPGYREKVAKFIRNRMDAAAYFPRLVSMEIVDEPHLYKANVDYSPPARREFRKEYGYDKPSWDEYLALKDRRRMEYFNSIIAYTSIAFRTSYEEIKAYHEAHHRKYPQVHHVYAQGGIHNPGICVFEQLEWSQYCHSIEFDSYPWLYGNFRAWDKIRMGETRYMFAYYRVLADYLDKPVGFFVETNDFYYPLEIWPVNSTNELLYVAVGSGAKRLHTMYLSSYALLNGVYEREKALARELKRVMEISPLLAVAKPARTNLGVFNAWGHRLYNPPMEGLPDGFEGIGFYPIRRKPYDTLYPNWAEPLNGLEAVYRAYGALPDVVDERILKSELPKYKAFVLLGAIRTMLPESFELLWEFVSHGGVLIMDGVPDAATDGKQDDRFVRLLDGHPLYLADGLRVRHARTGKGSILVIDGDLHDLMSRSYEQEKPMLREALVEALAGFLKENDIVPDAYSTNPEGIGVYEMTAEATRVLTLVNHVNTSASATIALKPAHGVASPECLVDFISGRRIRFTRTQAGIEFEVTLPSREAMIVGVYPDSPRKSELHCTANVTALQKWQWEFKLLNAGGQPARGSYPATVQVFSPSGKRMKCFERCIPAVNGVLQGEFVMPINPEKGAWKITGYNKLTFEELATTFDVT